MTPSTGLPLGSTEVQLSRNLVDFHAATTNYGNGDGKGNGGGKANFNRLEIHPDLVLSHLDVARGPLRGGSVVVVHGEGFVVKDGTVQASIWCRFGEADVEGTPLDHTRIQCVSPPASSAITSSNTRLKMADVKVSVNSLSSSFKFAHWE